MKRGRFYNGNGYLKRTRDGAIISPTDPRKRLRISNLEHYEDWTSIYEHVVRELCRNEGSPDGRMNRQEVVEHLALNAQDELADLERAKGADVSDSVLDGMDHLTRSLAMAPGESAFPKPPTFAEEFPNTQPRQFRGNFTHHKPTDAQLKQINHVRAACRDLCEYLEIRPPNREIHKAIEKLEEVSMWANKGIVLGS